MHRATRGGYGVGAALLLAWGTAAHAEPFNGGATAVASDGAYHNQNSFQAPTDVYLAGGPQSVNSSGLPDGYYFFQVTTPDGATLLSTDAAINRQVIVANGRVAGAVVTAHDGLAVPPAPHANGITQDNGSTPVQLFPFAPAPKNGSEYKVWLVRQKAPDHFSVLQTVSSIDSQDPQALVFDKNNAKTDNFRVQPAATSTETLATTSVGGFKFYDANVNGVFDAGVDTPLAGVRITVTLDGTLVDANGNAVDTATQNYSTTTDATGHWSIANVPIGSQYRVTEVVPITGVLGCNWIQTAPAPDLAGDRAYSGTAGADAVTDLNFGNVCLQDPRGGLTLGYWSNKNGQASMSVGGLNNTLAALSGLNLKDGLGSEFDPANYTQFRSWLLSGTATNMAYMLSVQFTASYLSVRCNGLSQDTVLFLSDDAAVSGSYQANVVSLKQVLTEANTDLGTPLHNLTKAGSMFRQHQECLKNICDDVNNNRLRFVLPAGACSVLYP